MARNSLAIKILSDTFKGSKLVRTSHSKATGCLHNAAATNFAVDSMSRVKGKLEGSEWEKNGLKRIGPTTAVLESVRGRSVDHSMSGEEGVKVIPSDPNSTMWQPYREKGSKHAMKKLKDNIRSMKENIKNYYETRCEKDLLIYAEMDEPLRITKINETTIPVKDVAAKNVEGRKKPVPQRSLLSKLQGSPIEKLLKAEKERTNRVAMNSATLYKALKHDEKELAQLEENLGVNKKPFRKYESNVSKSPQNSMMNSSCEGSEKPGKQDQLGMKAEKESKTEGFSEEVRGMKAPVFNFRTLHSSGLFQTIQSENFFRNMSHIMDSRGYCTLNNRNPYNLLYKGKRGVSYRSADQTPELMRRELVNQSNAEGGMVHNAFVKARAMTTCSKYHNAHDPCLPLPLPPRKPENENQPDLKLKKCEHDPPYDWGNVCKLTLCGCSAPHERLHQPKCGKEPDITASTAKKPEYMCPSFSECSLMTELNKRKDKECCMKEKCNSETVGRTLQRPFIFAIERQEASLGQKYWTGCSNRPFSTNSTRRQTENKGGSEEDSEEGCDKKKGDLPCLKASTVPGSRKKEKYKGKGSCERICLPCCQPARDPPECFHPYIVKPCTKVRNPRPSFSECRKMFPMKHEKCECEIPKKPLCEDKKKKEGDCQ